MLANVRNLFKKLIFVVFVSLFFQSSVEASATETWEVVSNQELYGLGTTFFCKPTACGSSYPIYWIEKESGGTIQTEYRAETGFMTDISSWGCYKPNQHPVDGVHCIELKEWASCTGLGGFTFYDTACISTKRVSILKTDIPPEPPCTDSCGCSGSGSGGGSASGGSGGFASNSSEAPGNSTFNVITGRVSHQQELYSTKAATAATSFILNYDSKYPLPGAFGNGWNHSYDISLNENSDGTMVLYGGGLSKRFYTKSVSGLGYDKNPLDSSTLIKNIDGTYLVTKIDGTKYTFTVGRKISGITDLYGNTISIDNTVIGTTIITDSVGHASKLTYDSSSGKVTSIKDPADNIYDFTYNTAGLLWKVTYPAPSTTETTRPYWEYLYNAAGLLEYKIDPARHIVRYEYNSQGRVQESTDPNGVPDTSGTVIAQGHTKSLVYNPATGVTNFTEKDGGTWIYTYDPLTMVLKEKAAPGGVIKNSFYYYPNLTLKAITKPFAIGKRLTTFYTYDDHGNILTETEPVDLSVYTNPPVDPASVDVTTLASLTPPIKWAFSYTYDYNNHDQIKSKTDLRGTTPLVTTYNYDYITEPGIEILKITDPENHVITYRNNADGTLKSIVDANNVSQTFTYASGLLASVTDQNRVLTKYTVYDNNGNPKQLQKLDNTGKLIVTTDLTYDALNRLRTVTNTTTDSPPVITVAKYDYDMSGNLTVYTDPETDPTVKQTKYEYNFNGQITKITDADQKETRFSYSGTGCTSCSGGVDKLTGVQDAKQLANSWPGTSYFYDQLGRLEHETDPRGKTIRYTYYDNSLLKDKIDASATPEKTLISHEYNNRGQLTKKQVLDSSGTGMNETTFDYDNNGNLKTAQNSATAYTLTWYKNGSLKSITDSLNRTVSYQYDGAGYRTVMTGPDGFPYYYRTDGGNNYNWWYTPMGIFDATYNAQGQLGRLTTGFVNTYDYDGLGRLKQLRSTSGNGQTLASYGYSYDRNGNRLTREEPAFTLSYTYDNIFRLKTVTDNYGAAMEGYSYDEVGNRQSGPAPDFSYLYSVGNQLDSNSATTYTYDNYGNLSTKTDGGYLFTYIHDGENRLTRVDIKKLVSGVLTSYSYLYDPFGRRIGKGSTRYVYDGDNILYEYNSNNVLMKRYVNGPGIDNALAYADQYGAGYYYIKDGIGSVTKRYAPPTSIISFNYDSFGKVKLSRGDTLTHGFTGRQYDEETGLYYYRARYYDPGVGRFIERDPISFAGGDVNLYGYVQNNPINLTDPSGLKPGDIFDSVELAVTDAISYATQLSNANRAEYGGWITKTKDCKFTYGDPTKGTLREIPNFPSKPANAADAWYHTHLPVNPLDRYLAGARPEEFSSRDRGISNQNHSVGYLGYGGNIYINYPR